MTISLSVETPEGIGRTWSVALAALFVGLVGYALAGRLRVPPLILVVSAVVPMLPGLSIFRGLSLLAEGNRFNTSEGLVALMTAASVALALAAGVILGEYVAQPLKREARRVESRLAGPRLVGPVRVLGRRRTRRNRRDSVSEVSRLTEQLGEPAPGGAVERRRTRVTRSRIRSRDGRESRPRRGSRARPGVARTRPRRRPTPARRGPRITSRSRSTARTVVPSHSGGVVMSTYTCTGPPSSWNVASQPRSTSGSRAGHQPDLGDRSDELHAGPASSRSRQGCRASRRTHRCRGTSPGTPSAALTPLGHGDQRQRCRRPNPPDRSTPGRPCSGGGV